MKTLRVPVFPWDANPLQDYPDSITYIYTKGGESGANSLSMEWQQLSDSVSQTLIFQTSWL